MSETSTVSSTSEQSLPFQRYGVAICTLASDSLRETLSQNPVLEDVLIGSLHTENIGIEQLISYCVSNPMIRFILLCGQDAQQAVGHLPGQSLLALSRFGLSEEHRIINAPGRRPELPNLSQEAVVHFRETVELIDLIGCEDPELILETFKVCETRTPGPSTPFTGSITPPHQTIEGYPQDSLQCDPNGYFVILLLQTKPEEDPGIRLEHYNNAGKLLHVILGKTAQELYIPAVELGLISQLDHAAYLGRELARAEAALCLKLPYVQDQGWQPTQS